MGVARRRKSAAPPVGAGSPPPAIPATPDPAREWEATQWVRHGWFYRIAGPADAHTVGVTSRWPPQPEFQLVFPLPPAAVHGFFWVLADLLDAGRRFAAGDECPDVLANGMPVRFAAVGTRLRLILPDPDGRVRRAEMRPDYARQYDGASDAQ